MIGKTFNNILHLVMEIRFEGGQSNSSRESDLKCELKVFTLLMFSLKISPFSFKAIFESPNECLLENCCLQLFQKGLESRRGF